MYLLDELKRTMKQKQVEKIMIFIDMDGVIADYRFGEGENIKSNKKGTYLNKRPIYTTINNLKLILMEKDFEMSIISSCLYIEQAEEKNSWIDKYAKFILKENRIFTIAENFEARKQLKVDNIRKYMEQNEDVLTVLIDDTHDILFLAQKQLGELFIPIHVITLID